MEERAGDRPASGRLVLDSVPAVVEAVMQPTLAVSSATSEGGTSASGGARQRSRRRRNLQVSAGPAFFLQSAKLLITTSRTTFIFLY